VDIRDEIRDQLYGSAEDEAERESLASGFDDLLSADGRPFGGQKTFVYCAVAEAIVAGLILFNPRYVSGVIDWLDTLIYGSIITFGIGFIATFNAYRILRNDVLPDNKPRVDSGVMSGYSGYDRRQRQFTVWLVASAGGVANILFLLLLLLVRY
jgi:hypothetical protein